MKNTKQIISERLSRLKETTPGLDTLEKIAERSGTSFGTVRRMINMETNPTAKSVEKVARAFGMSYEQFVSDSDTPPLDEKLMDTIKGLSPSSLRYAIEYEELDAEGKKFIAEQMDKAYSDSRSRKLRKLESIVKSSTKKP